jgi:aspartyl-tRNA(Asn)/glutamyl-tRNA(Gln) amidotransferase subunit A
VSEARAGEPLHYLGIGTLGRMLRERSLSPVEATQAYLARIEEVDPRLNSYVAVLADRALDQARRAEAEIGRGESRGPLHGVPIGLKDLFEVAGVRCTGGSAVLRDHVPQADGDAVARLDRAGAVLLGKHNMHEMAFGVTNENAFLGNCHNPWDLDRVPGGSSGGTAAAVAAGLCAAGLGSDTGGSIRVPAAFCGIVGMKPTYGVVSRKGALPLAWSLDHVGPLARSVEDCALMLEAVADDVTPTGRPSRDLFRFEHAEDLRGLRVGVPADAFFALVEPGVAEAFAAAVEQLRALGASVREVSLPTAQHAPAAGFTITAAEGAAWHDRWLTERASAYGDVLVRFRQGALTLAVDYLKAQKLRTLLQEEVAAALRDADVLALPTVAITAPEIGKTTQPGGPLNVVPRAVITRYTTLANLTGMPAASVPSGFADGLPVGLQILGPAYGDAAVLRVAYAHEQATEWHLRRPIP